MKSEKEITKTLENKINIINSSIDDIIGELYNIQLYKNMLNDFASKYSNELTDDFKIVIDKINRSIDTINSKSYLLEINKLSKIIKSNSGNFIEITTHVGNSTKNNPLFLNNGDEIDNGNNGIYEDKKDDMEINNYDQYDWIYDRELINTLNINLNKICFNVNDYENKKYYHMRFMKFF